MSSVNNKNKKMVALRVLDETAYVEVLGQFAMNPQLSIRKTA